MKLPSQTSGQVPQLRVEKGHPATPKISPQERNLLTVERREIELLPSQFKSSPSGAIVAAVHNREHDGSYRRDSGEGAHACSEFVELQSNMTVLEAPGACTELFELELHKYRRY